MGETLLRRRFGTSLTVVVMAGGLLRIVRLAATKWNRPLTPPLNDSLYYSLQARQLAHGIWFRELFTDQPGAEHGPLTSTLMAVVSWGNDPTNRQRLVTVACGIAAIAVIGLVGRRLGGDRVGLIAAMIAAVYPNLFVNDGLVMSESLSCLLVAVALLLMLQWVDAPNWRRAAWCGAVIGLGALARSEVLLLAPLAATLIVLVGRRRGTPFVRHSAAALAAAVAVLAPWTVFNATRFDRPVALTTNEGPLWLGANCADSFYGQALGGWSLLCVLDAHVGEHGEDPSVRSAAQRRLGLSYAADHTTRLPVVVAARVGRTLDLYAVGSLVTSDVGEERERLVSWAGVISFWLLAPIAALGARRLRSSHRAVMLLPIAVVAVTTVVFYGGHRIRSSAEPALVVLAAVAIERWLTQREAR